MVSNPTHGFSGGCGNMPSRRVTPNAKHKLAFENQAKHVRKRQDAARTDGFHLHRTPTGEEPIHERKIRVSGVARERKRMVAPDKPTASAHDVDHVAVRHGLWAGHFRNNLGNRKRSEWCG